MEIKEQILALRAAGKRPPYTVKSPSGELMAIADEFKKHVKGPFSSADIDEILYDEDGLPK